MHRKWPASPSFTGKPVPNLQFSRHRNRLTIDFRPAASWQVFRRAESNQLVGGKIERKIPRQLFRAVKSENGIDFPASGGGESAGENESASELRNSCSQAKPGSSRAKLLSRLAKRVIYCNTFAIGGSRRAKRTTVPAGPAWMDGDSRERAVNEMLHVRRPESE